MMCIESVWRVLTVSTVCCKCVLVLPSSSSLQGASQQQQQQQEQDILLAAAAVTHLLQVFLFPQSKPAPAAHGLMVRSKSCLEAPTNQNLLLKSIRADPDVVKPADWRVNCLIRFKTDREKSVCCVGVSTGSCTGENAHSSALLSDFDWCVNSEGQCAALTFLFHNHIGVFDRRAEQTASLLFTLSPG